MALGDKVLVATDLSESADEAIRQGHVIAGEAGGKLVVCHVVHEATRYAPLFPQRLQAETETLIAVERQAANAVEQRVSAVTGRSLDAPESFEVNITTGSADAEILRVAEEVGATLIVTGSRGLTGIRRMLLGNVAERIVRYAHCPVLVVRKHEPTNRILAPTDLSERATPAVDLAAQIAQRRGGTLVVMHSLDIVPRPAFGFTVPFGGLPVIPPPEVVTQARTGAEEVLTGMLERLGAKGERRVVEGDAATSIIQMADETGTDLVVVSTHGRTGLARVALGSVAEKVVRGAHCSVLVVRSH
ncbi:universal stress protein [Polyangium aurulentum]|uniref:universal stress protein n=1 Tax=Polyangium aurulentum TaxID=2567896 RepID=UPI0010ADDDD6|nr:universal stress protein [Polyangium aurulentum]UQA61274.1 universal stress protein [Polyangium aurulentum]